MDVHVVILAGNAEDELRFLKSLPQSFSQCLVRAVPNDAMTVVSALMPIARRILAGQALDVQPLL